MKRNHLFLGDDVYPNIAIYGRTGSGKSTVASELVGRYGYSRAHPGGVCRDITRRLFSSDDKTRLNQVNDAIRGIDPDVWVRVSLDEVPAGRPIVLDGIRFFSNLEYLKERGFQLWKIESPAALRKHRLDIRGQDFDTARDSMHAGESELQDIVFDAVIQNDSDMSALLAQISIHIAASAR